MNLDDLYIAWAESIAKWASVVAHDQNPNECPNPASVYGSCALCDFSYDWIEGTISLTDLMANEELEDEWRSQNSTTLGDCPGCPIKYHYYTENCHNTSYYTATDARNNSAVRALASQNMLDELFTMLPWLPSLHRKGVSEFKEVTQSIMEFEDANTE